MPVNMPAINCPLNPDVWKRGMEEITHPGTRRHGRSSLAGCPHGHFGASEEQGLAEVDVVAVGQHGRLRPAGRPAGEQHHARLVLTHRDVGKAFAGARVEVEVDGAFLEHT